jgi:hypothetical protein
MAGGVFESWARRRPLYTTLFRHAHRAPGERRGDLEDAVVKFRLFDQLFIRAATLCGNNNRRSYPR